MSWLSLVLAAQGGPREISLVLGVSSVKWVLKSSLGCFPPLKVWRDTPGNYNGKTRVLRVVVGGLANVLLESEEAGQVPG